MNSKIAKKEMRRIAGNRLIRVRANELYHLLKTTPIYAHSERVEGWACDYYEIQTSGSASVWISSGYDAIGEKILSDEELKKFDDKAREILEHGKDYKSIKRRLDNLLYKFADEADKRIEGGK